MRRNFDIKIASVSYTNARWVLKHSKAKTKADGAKPIDIAIPVFGYKSHIAIDRKHGIIRGQMTTDAAKHDGAKLRERLIDGANTSGNIWADSAYRSAENEGWIDAHGHKSQIHRKSRVGQTDEQGEITGKQ